jgi:hypothetical protein
VRCLVEVDEDLDPPSLAPGRERAVHLLDAAAGCTQGRSSNAFPEDTDEDVGQVDLLVDDVLCVRADARP